MTRKNDRKAKESGGARVRAHADVAILRKRIAQRRTSKPYRPQDDRRVQQEFHFNGEVQK